MEQAFLIVTQISDTATCIICHKYVGVHILCQLQGYRSEVAICEMCVRFNVWFWFTTLGTIVLSFLSPHTFNGNLVLITLISVSLF